MKKHILIVDDDIRVAHLIKDSLADLGDDYDVQAAASGEEALQQMNQGEWDLVVADQQMPGISGLELIATLKDRAPNVLTILMTGFGSDEIELAARRLQVYQYVTKPFTLDEIERVVLAALEFRQRLDVPSLRLRAAKARAALKVTLGGDGNVGKTTLMRRLGTGVFEPERAMTIGVDFHVYDIQHHQSATRLIVWDVSGQDRFAFTRRAFYRGSKSVGLVYDVSTRSTFERLPLWREEIQAVLPHVPMVLVGNKIDLPRQVSTREGRALAEVWGAPFIETSCLTGDGVQDLFGLLEEAARNSAKQ